MSDIRYRTSRLSVDKIFLIILRVFEKIRYFEIQHLQDGPNHLKRSTLTEANDLVTIIINILKIS